ncbi:MAG: CCA tRNA nucleotidyltransferase [Paracoccaceae bacterium]|nr:CCA tRNA nucleotidyltransferase [Paracoccaceae bacterium]MDG1738385.1 CCA tRNA nucleotidyltransferase [Paracoccaceae bacterium]MDG2259867.1 CCA tRNA nucleotidyltransferase [Paracoccaceae bacterium]
MKLTGEWLHSPATQAVFSVLTDAGYQAYLVGGCVRNALISANVTDFDISTDATPTIVTKLAENAGLRVIPTGIEHGTVTVVSGGIPHEITTFRKDMETDGRHAVVSFSTSIDEDAARRDFTMNALYADATGKVLDPLGGLADLNARHVRFIGNAGDRIREDYLRILRFFRFTAWYGDTELGFDQDALAAIGDNLAGIESLSKERVGQELQKLLLAPNPSPAIAVMQQTGVLHAILPGADSKALSILVHHEAKVDLAPSFPRRLAALGPIDAKEMLRVSKSNLRDRDAIFKAATEMDYAQEAGYRLGATLGTDSRLLRSALLETNFDTNELEQVSFGAAAKLPVKAADLMDQFQGPALGEKLRQLENAWIASGFSLTKQQLLES